MLVIRRMTVRFMVLAATTVVALGLGTRSVRAQRTTDGLVMLYDFQEGWGDTVHDTSGFGDPIDLKIQEPDRVTWGPGSLSVNDKTIMVSFVPARKLYDASVATNEFTIEVWITPALLGQEGPARIISYSSPTSDAANFTIGQDVDNGVDVYQMRLRTSTTGAKGRPRRLQTVGGSVTLALTHLMYTFEASGQARFYIDGQVTPLEDGGNYVGDGFIGGNFTDPGHRDLPEPTGRGAHDGWTDNYTLNLANEDDLDFGGPLIDRSDVTYRPWLGTYYLAAVYSRALTAEEVARHFEAGPCPASVVTGDVTHLRTDPIILNAPDLPIVVSLNVALSASNAGSVTVSSSDPSVAGGGTIDFAGDGSTCGSTSITVAGVGTTHLDLSNDMGLANGVARRVIVIDPIDLGDIVSAGDGKGNKLPIFEELLELFGPIVGVDQDTGIFQNDRLADIAVQDPNEQVEVADTDGINPIAMDGNNGTDDVPWIDSAFIMDADAMPINSAGVSFGFESGDSNPTGWDFIFDGLEPGGPLRLQIGSYNTADGVGIHASSGITYNLDELRATHGDAAVGFFSAGVGEAIGAPGTEGAGVGGTVNNYIILSSDTAILSSIKLGPHTDSGEMVELAIPAEAKYLTLAVGAAGDGIGDGTDRGVFLDAFITPDSLLDLIRIITVDPDRVALAGGETARLRVLQSFAGRGDLSAEEITADGYTSDNTAVTTVDANGVVTAVGNGTATITALLGGLPAGTATVTVSGILQPPPTLVAVMGGLGAAADEFISPLGDDVPFDTAGLTLSADVELAAPVPGLTLTSNGNGQHTLMLDTPITPGQCVPLSFDVRAASGATGTISITLCHQPLDINQDGRTNIADATAFGNEFRGALRAALIDINGNGAVNVQDATAFGVNWISWANTSLNRQ